MPIDNDFSPALEAAAKINREQGDPLPCVPSALHWLGDRRGAEDTAHALDMRGCVLYFATDIECQKFMGWLTRRALG